MYSICSSRMIMDDLGHKSKYLQKDQRYPMLLRLKREREIYKCPYEAVAYGGKMLLLLLDFYIA